MVQEQEIEIWSKVPNYEGLYQVSSFGRVKSLKRKWVKQDRILSPYKPKNGYLEVGLSSGTPRKEVNHRIHSLVSEVFDRPLSEGETVNHIDGNKSNNKISNLEIITRSENTRHAWDTGINNQVGYNSVNSKLTKEDVLYIRESRDKRSNLAKKFCVSRQTIDNVINKKCYYDI